MELDERKAAILRAIVEEHISTAQPVGSQTIARSRGLGVSSATVRNDMTVLEREGYLVQPHTSAGRVPTDRGYRFFVDNFEGQPGLAPAQRRVVADFFTLFQSAHQVLEDLLHETSHLLARVSTHTAVVVGPHSETLATVRSVQLVSLQPSLVLALAILSNGSVEKCLLHVADDLDDAIDRHRRRAARHAARRLPLGRAARAAIRRPAPRPTPWPRRRGTRSRPAPSRSSSNPSTWAAPAASRPSRRRSRPPPARHASWSSSSARSRWSRWSTTSSTRAPPCASAPRTRSTSCATARSSWRRTSVDGEVAGTVGVLGPTRMDYRQALAAVEAISQQLGDVLS